MIDRFTKSEFEAALPTDKTTHSRLWVAADGKFSEHAYAIPVNDYVVILVLSSIRRGATTCDDTGANSIRAWLVDAGDYTVPLCMKEQAYIKRTKGWRGNLTRVLRELYKKGILLGTPCPTCGNVLAMRKVKRGSNEGRVYVGCSDMKCKDSFIRFLKEGEIQ